MLKLGTLIKYDMKALGRVLLPIYGGTVAVAIIIAIFFSIVSRDDKFMDRFGWFVGPLPAWVGSFAVATLMVAGIAYVIQRFTTNLLGKEGYLTLTLPVSINAHIASKAISATIWMSIGVILSFIVGAILYLTPADILFETRMILATEVEPGYRLSFILTALEIFLLAVVAIMEAIIKIYAAVSIGQRWSNHKGAGGALAYVAIMIIELAVALIIDAVVANPFVLIDGLSDLAFFQATVAIIMLIAAALGALYWAITKFMLSKHLNLQ